MWLINNRHPFLIVLEVGSPDPRTCQSYCLVTGLLLPGLQQHLLVLSSLGTDTTSIYGAPTLMHPPNTITQECKFQHMVWEEVCRICDF